MKEDIRAILTDYATWAVVGLSPDPARDSNRIGRLLQARGKRVVPVNPAVEEVLGERAWPSLLEVPPELGVEVVDVFRRADRAGRHVDEAVAIGAQAARRARAAGLRVVMNRCPAIEWPRLEAA